MLEIEYSELNNKNTIKNKKRPLGVRGLFCRLYDDIVFFKGLPITRSRLYRAIPTIVFHVGNQRLILGKIGFDFFNCVRSSKVGPRRIILFFSDQEFTIHGYFRAVVKPKCECIFRNVNHFRIPLRDFLGFVLVKETAGESEFYIVFKHVCLQLSSLVFK